MTLDPPDMSAPPKIPIVTILYIMQREAARAFLALLFDPPRPGTADCIAEIHRTDRRDPSVSPTDTLRYSAST